MGKWLAGVLRRWADWLDPVAVVPAAPVAVVAVQSTVLPSMRENVKDGQDTFRVLADQKRELYHGPRGAEASRRFLNEKRNKVPVELFHNEERRDWWPR